MVPTHDAGLPGGRGERTRAVCNDVGAPRGAVPREISQAEKEIPRDRTYMWNLRNKTREQAKRPQTQARRELRVAGCKVGGGLGGWRGGGGTRTRELVAVK